MCDTADTPLEQGPIGIVSGSGLDLCAVLDHVDETIPFHRFKDLPARTLEGHERTFIHGGRGSRHVILQSGRFHFYEGLDFDTVVRPVDILYKWGVRAIVFTNVCGGLLPDLARGDLVSVTRIHTWPFVRWPDRPETIDADFSIAGCDRAGTYCWMHGPSYETPAEIRTLQHRGASVVGMSTAPEVVRCRQLGIRAAVVSCVTNNCCKHETLSHDRVVQAATEASGRLAGILRNALA